MSQFLGLWVSEVFSFSLHSPCKFLYANSIDLIRYHILQGLNWGCTICIIPQNGYLGPVVQSIVSLTSSLRGQLVKYFMTLSPNKQIFFVHKMREAFAMQNLLTFFQQKNIGVFEILTFEILTKR